MPTPPDTIAPGVPPWPELQLDDRLNAKALRELEGRINQLRIVVNNWGELYKQLEKHVAAVETDAMLRQHSKEQTEIARLKCEVLELEAQRGIFKQLLERAVAICDEVLSRHASSDPDKRIPIDDEFAERVAALALDTAQVLEMEKK